MKSNNSIISNLFNIQTLSKTKCLKCQNILYQNDIHRMLPLKLEFEDEININVYFQFISFDIITR